MRRATQAGYQVSAGDGNLQEGFRRAQQLWNALWWAMFGYNNRLRLARGDTWETMRRLRTRERYPGRYGFEIAMRDHPAYRGLSDRCASYTVLDFDIACRSWFSNLRENPRAKPPGPARKGRTLTFEVGRNARAVGPWTYRLTVLGGREPDRHAVIRVTVRPGVRMEGVKLLRVRPDGTVSLIREVEPAPSAGDGVAALDLGLVNLGALVFASGESILYSNRGLLDVLRHTEKRAARCKPSGWRPGRKRLPLSKRRRHYKRSGTNTMALVVHNFTTSVIRECRRRGVGVLLVGNLTGVTGGKDYGAATNQQMFRWPHREIRNQLRWKGEEAGVEVREVSEAYTSQTCAVCGHRSKAAREKRGLYACRRCGARLNADINAAWNILKKYRPAAERPLGVGADLPGPPSPSPGEGNRRTTEVAASHPTWVAKFGLRDWRIVMTRPVAVEQAVHTAASGLAVGCTA